MNELKLYEYTSEFFKLKDEIENSIDENGEIPDFLAKKLDEFNTNKLIKVSNCVEYYRELSNNFDAISNRIKELTVLKIQAENKVEWIKNYLSTNLNGEVVKQPKFSITYRNSETVEVSDELELEILHRMNPELIDKKVVYSVNKNVIKEYVKKGLPIPEGIIINKKSNIQIK
jgi:hypothetical protein